MPIRVPKVDALAAQLPRALFFHADATFWQPRFWANSEREMKLTVTVVRRRHAKRAALLEKQQHLSIACLQGATAIPKVTDHREAEDAPVELC